LSNWHAEAANYNSSMVGLAIEQYNAGICKPGYNRMFLTLNQACTPATICPMPRKDAYVQVCDTTYLACIRQATLSRPTNRKKLFTHG